MRSAKAQRRPPGGVNSVFDPKFIDFAIQTVGGSAPPSPSIAAVADGGGGGDTADEDSDLVIDEEPTQPTHHAQHAQRKALHSSPDDEFEVDFGTEGATHSDNGLEMEEIDIVKNDIDVDMEESSLHGDGGMTTAGYKLNTGFNRNTTVEETSPAAVPPTAAADSLRGLTESDQHVLPNADADADMATVCETEDEEDQYAHDGDKAALHPTPISRRANKSETQHTGFEAIQIDTGVIKDSEDEIEICDDDVVVDDKPSLDSMFKLEGSLDPGSSSENVQNPNVHPPGLAASPLLSLLRPKKVNKVPTTTADAGGDAGASHGAPASSRKRTGSAPNNADVEPEEVVDLSSEGGVIDPELPTVAGETPTPPPTVEDTEVHVGSDEDDGEGNLPDSGEVKSGEHAQQQAEWRRHQQHQQQRTPSRRPNMHLRFDDDDHVIDISSPSKITQQSNGKGGFARRENRNQDEAEVWEHQKWEPQGNRNDSSRPSPIKRTKGRSGSGAYDGGGERNPYPYPNDRPKGPHSANKPLLGGDRSTGARTKQGKEMNSAHSALQVGVRRHSRGYGGRADGGHKNRGKRGGKVGKKGGSHRKESGQMDLNGFVSKHQ